MRTRTTTQNILDIFKGIGAGIVVSFGAFSFAYIFALFACHFATSCTL